MEEKKCGDDSSMVLIDDNHLWKTITVGNKYLSGNNIMEIRDLVLSSLRIGINIGGAKYSIY